MVWFNFLWPKLFFIVFLYWGERHFFSLSVSHINRTSSTPSSSRNSNTAIMYFNSVLKITYFWKSWIMYLFIIFLSTLHKHLWISLIFSLECSLKFYHITSVNGTIAFAFSYNHITHLASISASWAIFKLSFTLETFTILNNFDSNGTV